MTGRKGAGKGTSPSRTGAEWVSFGAAVAVLAVVVVLIAAQMTGAQSPPAPIAARHGRVREVKGRYFVPVRVVNEGDETAADVQVSAELTIGGETTEGDQTIDFLAGDEEEDLTFAFDDDPADGELVISVRGFTTP
jgi:uncharacterized protein (TIGR02588 family)